MGRHQGVIVRGSRGRGHDTKIYVGVYLVPSCN